MFEEIPNEFVSLTKRHRERDLPSQLKNHFETYLPFIREPHPPVIGGSSAPILPQYHITNTEFRCRRDAELPHPSNDVNE